MKLEDQIEQIRQDIQSERYTVAAKECAGIIEFAFREIYRRSIGEVDGSTRKKAFEVEDRLGGPSKDVSSFTLGELVGLFREAKLFDAYSKATGRKLRAITMIDFSQVVTVRNRMQHGREEVGRGEAQLFLHCVENMLEAFGILSLEAAEQGHPAAGRAVRPDEFRHATWREKQQSSTYNAQDAGELERLADQGELTRTFDLQMFEYALGGVSRPLTGLDIGCSQGDITRDRFGSFEDAFDIVIGVDSDPECIRGAGAELEQGSPYVFAELDIEGASAEDNLHQLLIEHAAPDRPVVAFLSMILHHLAAPIRVLKLLRSVLPRGSKVVIHTLDDGLILGYPSRDDRLARVLEAGGLGRADPFHGRKLHYQLYRSGFRKLQLFGAPYFLPNYDESVRQMMFRMAFGFRPKPYERAIESGEAGAELEQTLAQLRDDLEEIELDFQDPAFSYMALSLGGVATVH
jgi:SAM-dependent methyltransferase